MALGYGESIRFNYTGKSQYTTLGPGKYRIQCYGARGRSGTNGGYSIGYIRLKKDTKLWVYCGESPNNGYIGGWNGGGNCSHTSGYGGGGRTSVSLNGIDNSASWNTTEHMQNIIMCAKGGNGAGYTYQTGGTYKTLVNNASTNYSGTYQTTVYRFTPSVSGKVYFWSNLQSASTGDPYGFIYRINSSGTAVLVSSNNNSNGNSQFYMSANVSPNYTYEFRIRHFVASYEDIYRAYYTITYDTRTYVTVYGYGAGSNYGYAGNSSGYPFGTCALKGDVTVESFSYSSSGGSSGHGYCVITRVPVDIHYTNCSGSKTQTYGDETITLSTIIKRKVDNYLKSYVLFEVSPLPDKQLRKLTETIYIPKDLWYDIYVDAIYVANLRYNSNIYHETHYQDSFDFNKFNKIVGDL